MNRREAFAAAIGAVCASMFPRPSGGMEEEIARVFGVDGLVPLPTPYYRFLAEEARFCREVVEPMQLRLAQAMQAKIDRDWA